MTSSSLGGGPERGESVRNIVAGGRQRGPVLMGRDFEVKVPLPERAGRPVSLPPRPTALAGREGSLADLHERLAEGGAPWPRVVALHGVGGAGKTTVAVEYAHRHLADVSVVWLFPAQDRTGLEAEFARLAALLGASGGLLDPRDPVASVHGALADSELPWLVVFDDVPDASTVREFLPPAGPGRVLITSQNGVWPPGQGMEVRPLDVDVAAGFLVNRTGEADPVGLEYMIVAVTCVFS
jgi:hypothetical protein